MRTYFAVSDIHSFYEPLIKGLYEANFDVNNPEHILIVCGDVFDRGPDAFRVYKFLTDLPEDRVILIRGNHEDLFIGLIEGSYALSKKVFSNGTIDTIEQILGIRGLKKELYREFRRYYYEDMLFDNDDTPKSVTTLPILWNNICEKIKEREVYKWLTSDRWKHYYEIGNYIFTHAAIPLQEDWREPTAPWRTYAWLNPLANYLEPAFNEYVGEDKVVVCGHYVTELYREDYPHCAEPYGIFRYKNFIGIDGGIWFYGDKINVLKVQP